jgi:hypothetical protein
MPATPAKTMEYLNSVLIPWKETANEDIFSETKVNEFEADVKESVDSRVRIANLEAEIDNEKKLRDQIDERNIKRAQRIVLSVAGHPKHGKDSGLYKAMGFVPTSERKSGLTRKKKKTTPPNP